MQAIKWDKGDRDFSAAWVAAAAVRLKAAGHSRDRFDPVVRWLLSGQEDRSRPCRRSEISILLFRSKIASQHQWPPQQGDAARIVGQRFAMQRFGQRQRHGIAGFPPAREFDIGAGLGNGRDRFAVNVNGEARSRPGRAAQRQRQFLGPFRLSLTVAESPSGKDVSITR
jgi:hypothetical protein